MTTSSDWPDVPLGDILVKNEKTVPVLPEEEYREVTIRLWGKGVVLRRRVLGAEIAAEKRFQVSSGQFIISRIDARNGAAGIVPPELDGAVVSNDFPTFEAKRDRLVPEFLGWISKTPRFLEMCRRASEGTTNRVRLKEDQFLRLTIPLPSTSVQKHIVTRIERVVAKIDDATLVAQHIDEQWSALLRSSFSQVISGVPRRKMEIVAPLIRRKTNPQPDQLFPELGIRSFGKGTFHKPPLEYLSIGTKKLYAIEPGDLVFNNVFAWEGAIAVAKPDDAGRFGSHRFITCRAIEGVASPEFLCFYFLTPEGLQRIGEASPGGAGRNRTLGLEKLAELDVPVPEYEEQLKFGRLLSSFQQYQSIRATTRRELEAILPSLLDKAFRGAL
jgi:type I restriction enzyme S subunit